MKEKMVMNIEQVKQKDYYIKIQNILNDLYDSGVISNGSGYCLSMSDIVYKLLYKHGIKSKLVECSLLVLCNKPPSMIVMGYPGFRDNNYDPKTKMENHIVCVTDTEVPILIDASISFIDAEVKYICYPLLRKDRTSNICEIVYDTSTWMYQEKTESVVPDLHQKSILDRINLDRKFSNDIELIRKFVFVIIGITTLNFVRGSFDFYQTYINKSNNWGPSVEKTFPYKND